ncbi:MAG: aminopeptidase P family N-terminal domain-containing protein, partial [Firmicutes bacterium]|nr:aminopeptidase P family N-terminal domain-containing protein [Bacillota bacterium]
MNETIQKRLAALREKMAQEGVSACYIPTSDFHGSEYIGDYFQVRRFFSGFTGSAGTLVVTAEEAGLWTDGRYFLQAEEQLAGTGIDLYKMGEPGVPTAEAWLADHMAAGTVLALDGRVTEEAQYAQLEKSLKKAGILLRTGWDPAEGIWLDRPAPAANPVWPLDVKYTGESAADKLARLRKVMAETGANAHVMTTLDDIAWLFNLRGGDIDYNPVFLAYAAVEEDGAWLFTEESRLTAEALQAVKEAGAEIRPYEEIYEFVQKYSGSDKVLVSVSQMNHQLYGLLRDRAVLVKEAYNPVTLMKNKKNGVEQENFREAHRKDGQAVVRFLYRVKQAAANLKSAAASGAASEFAAAP